MNASVLHDDDVDRRKIVMTMAIILLCMMIDMSKNDSSKLDDIIVVCLRGIFYSFSIVQYCTPLEREWKNEVREVSRRQEER